MAARGGKEQRYPGAKHLSVYVLSCKTMHRNGAAKRMGDSRTLKLNRLIFSNQKSDRGGGFCNTALKLEQFVIRSNYINALFAST